MKAGMEPDRGQILAHSGEAVRISPANIWNVVSERNGVPMKIPSLFLVLGFIFLSLLGPVAGVRDWTQDRLHRGPLDAFTLACLDSVA